MPGASGGGPAPARGWPTHSFQFRAPEMGLLEITLNHSKLVESFDTFNILFGLLVFGFLFISLYDRFMMARNRGDDTWVFFTSFFVL